jgi:CRISPR-associated RAMP protein (TIGR02581 family)
MFDTFKNRLEITGILWTVTALRISAGRSTEPIGSDLPVIKDALGRPFIPGSSLKGALRSRLESFLRGIAPNLAEDPSELSSTGRISQVNALKETANNDKNATEQILEQTDLVSRLFGAPWLASKFQIRDLTVLPDYWFGQYQERDGVAIDRDTETAADGKLYDYQVVPADTPFQFHAVVENAEEWELGLLMLGLHQLETEQIPLGGGRSRGLGVVKLRIDKMCWFDYPKDQPQLLLDYLKKLVMNDDSAYKDANQYKDHWIKKLIEHLQNQSNSQEVKNVV